MPEEPANAGRNNAGLADVDLCQQAISEVNKKLSQSMFRRVMGSQVVSSCPAASCVWYSADRQSDASEQGLALAMLSLPQSACPCASQGLLTRPNGQCDLGVTAPAHVCLVVYMTFVGCGLNCQAS